MKLIESVPIVCGRVCPSGCPICRSLQQRAVGAVSLLLSAPRAGDINRQRRPQGAQQHGGQQ